MKRHEFYYPFKIGVNKRFTVRNRSNFPPTPTIDAGEAGKNQLPYKERVEIRCVIFEDGSIWQKSGVEESACQKLGEIIRKRRQ